MTVNVELTEYEGWEHCIRLTNGHVELVATTAVGPRIVHFGPVGGDNLLYLDPDVAGQTGGDEWELYGGHRLWHAPEDDPRTLVPDNDPVQYDLTDTGCVLIQDTEALTGLRKEIEISMTVDAPAVTIDHRITNDGVWPVSFAPWAITVLERGGKGIVELPEGDASARLPDRSVTLWPATNPGDDRLEWVDDHLLVRQGGDTEMKIGTSGAEEWTAYVNDGHALLKTFEWDADATYPDRGCSVEMFQLPFMFELETLGPKTEVNPGETVSHTEGWHLVDGVERPASGDDVRAMGLPEQ